MATCISNTYEAARNQQVELNKKKFEDLGILKISKNLAELPSPEKKSQQRPPKPRLKTTCVSEPRRSSRARNPVPSYRDDGLPSTFCEDRLPKTVLDMVLEDEDSVEFPATYIGKRAGLSGGWTAFALDHKLDDGDALVFELTEPTRFKIYIIKAFPLFIQEKSEDYEDKEEIYAAKTTLKAGLKLESQPNQKQKSRKAAVHASDDLENPQKLQPESERNREDKSRDENPTKTSGMVSQRFQRKVIQLALVN
ncbi:hypothetical protein FH972_009909 [Carpinus fangiana]|uniref:TF-B3 domain-containing protein n=1 Tax=Carpinus fangiana TaxID=176857 RepID=A0A660KST1_9ROSI|nr:hypothetical protein FH972_009909 [Carpinus fangiana]